MVKYTKPEIEVLKFDVRDDILLVSAEQDDLTDKPPIVFPDPVSETNIDYLGE